VISRLLSRENLGHNNVHDLRDYTIPEKKDYIIQKLKIKQKNKVSAE
jgi:hypothetical protein